jgi:hypothetical protein
MTKMARRTTFPRADEEKEKGIYANWPAVRAFAGDRVDPRKETEGR